MGSGREQALAQRFLRAPLSPQGPPCAVELLAAGDQLLLDLVKRHRTGEARAVSEHQRRRAVDAVFLAHREVALERRLAIAHRPRRLLAAQHPAEPCLARLLRAPDVARLL